MSDETATTTPADRLLGLLEAGRSRRGPDTTAGAVWAEISSVAHDSPEYIRLVADINVMIASLIQLVADSPMTERAKENYSAILRHMLTAFQGNVLAAPWEHTRKTYLTDQQIDNLENLDSQLAHWYRTEEISTEQISKLKTELDQVREQIDESDLPPELTKLIRSHLEAIRRVLSHYSIYGTDGLQDALKRILGELVLNHQSFEQHGNSPAMRALKSFLLKAFTVANLSASAITIGDAVRRLLGD